MQNGFAFSSKKFSETTGTPLIRIRDLKTGNCTTTRFNGEFDPSHLVDDGDLLIGMDGEFACYEWSGGPALLNQRVCRLINFSDAVLPRFVFYGINKHLKEIEEQTTFTTVKHLSSKKIKAIEFPLPPLEEQRRIVAKLDQAFAALDRARAHTEANLADASELLENGVNGVFTELAASAPVLPLADAVHSDCKLSYGIVQPGDEVTGGLPVVRPVDLKSRIVSRQGLKTILPDRAEGYARTKLVGGEILLCVRGSTGEMSVADTDLSGANVTRGIVPIRFPEETVLPEFAYFQLRSKFAQDQIAARTYGAALMQINIKDLRKLQFILPEIERQRETLRRVEALYANCERLVSSYAARLADIDDLRQSILQEAFSGQLT